MEKIVIALGGNALQSRDAENTARGQLMVLRRTVKHIVEVCKKGYSVYIVHGNGPQVGRILLASEAAKDFTPEMPFDVCGAMSQGYIGYQIQQALKDALTEEGIHTPVITVVTQIEVDKNDPGFSDPTKPIGPFYVQTEAERLSAQKAYTMKEDAGRGWRRVVPSPMPRRIVEIDAIKAMGENAIVISCGGGGIPVVENEDGSLEGTAAVIDKDHAAELLAEELGADSLLILTEVEKVAVNWNKPEQRSLDKMTVDEANNYISEGHFAPGSMLPKVEAAVAFVKAFPNKRAIITDLDHSVLALEGKTGTCITR